jgi:hypothetical protein
MPSTSRIDHPEDAEHARERADAAVGRAVERVDEAQDSEHDQVDAGEDRQRQQRDVGIDDREQAGDDRDRACRDQDPAAAARARERVRRRLGGHGTKVPCRRSARQWRTPVSPLQACLPRPGGDRRARGVRELGREAGG